MIIIIIIIEINQSTDLFTLSPEEYKVGILVKYYELKINANQQIFDGNNYVC